ncbi:AMP-binding protein [Aquirhabdus parva]|uniref:AMP-dependent synthetase/ligase domain-containing protein n=1 Tax=Aquirhabdus parva TaxID=2283318 RepID=A0A345P935_9GAMM|nr:AMP-binding protein [Aquirhabdus parva]AXI03794.1 hypothetical protein HYN46_13705 [Aquirhabdus parva]
MQWLNQILTHCQNNPDHPMVEVLSSAGESTVYRSQEIVATAEALSQWLNESKVLRGRPLKIGLVTHNSVEWVVADLALLLSNSIEVPVPLAFSTDQAAHLLHDVDLCLVDQKGLQRLNAWFPENDPELRCPPYHLLEMDTLLALAKHRVPDISAVHAPADDEQTLCKIIHTSGTTSRPKGVKIRSQGIGHLLVSLHGRVAKGTYARYLSLVPLSLLIEQVVGVYLTFLDGGTLVFLPANEPLLGESNATTKQMLTWLARAKPAALTLPPSMVEALLAECRLHPNESVAARLSRLFGEAAVPFIACGGAPTDPKVLLELIAYGLPVYEGYGLSENSSVVAWNSPHCFKLGTVGKPLEHVQIKLNAHKELLVKSTSLFAGYANLDPSSCDIDSEGWLHTGDIAEIDDEGYLRIFGRKKNLIITANGRNVSPEWVESRYKSLDAVEHAVLFGDGLESLHGFFVIAPQHDLNHAATEIQAFGRHLSEIERVEQISVVQSSEQIYADFFTVTGRPLRDRIWAWMNESRAATTATHPAPQLVDA